MFLAVSFSQRWRRMALLGLLLGHAVLGMLLLRRVTDQWHQTVLLLIVVLVLAFLFGFLARLFSGTGPARGLLRHVGREVSVLLSLGAAAAPWVAAGVLRQQQLVSQRDIWVVALAAAGTGALIVFLGRIVIALARDAGAGRTATGLFIAGVGASALGLVQGLCDMPVCALLRLVAFSANVIVGGLLLFWIYETREKLHPIR